MRFDLVPFNTSDIAVGGEISLIEDTIDCSWWLSGALDDVLWPAEANPNRRMGLWQHTCLELFIGPTSTSGYCEFNLSPSGLWNSFEFEDVRQQMRETPLLECLASESIQDASGRKRVSATLRFDAWPDSWKFRLGISAVIELRDGTLQYFALRHPAARPDFHDRAGHGLHLLRKAA